MKGKRRCIIILLQSRRYVAVCHREQRRYLHRKCPLLFTMHVHIPVEERNERYRGSTTYYTKLGLDPLRKLFVVGNVRPDRKNEPFPRVRGASRTTAKDSRPPPLISLPLSTLSRCIEWSVSSGDLPRRLNSLIPSPVVDLVRVKMVIKFRKFGGLLLLKRKKTRYLFEDILRIFRHVWNTFGSMMNFGEI